MTSPRSPQNVLTSPKAQSLLCYGVPGRIVGLTSRLEHDLERLGDVWPGYGIEAPPGCRRRRGRPIFVCTCSVSTERTSRYHKIIEAELRPLWRAVEVDVRAKLPTSQVLPVHHRLRASIGWWRLWRGDLIRTWRTSIAIYREPGARHLFQEAFTSPLRRTGGGLRQRRSWPPRISIGVTMNGQPPTWAADFVHNDVTARMRWFDPNPVVAPNVQALEDLHPPNGVANVRLSRSDRRRRICHRPPTRDESTGSAQIGRGQVSAQMIGTRLRPKPMRFSPTG